MKAIVIRELTCAESRPLLAALTPRLHQTVANLGSIAPRMAARLSNLAVTLPGTVLEVSLRAQCPEKLEETLGSYTREYQAVGNQNLSLAALNLLFGFYALLEANFGVEQNGTQVRDRKMAWISRSLHDGTIKCQAPPKVDPLPLNLQEYLRLAVLRSDAGIRDCCFIRNFAVFEQQHTLQVLTYERNSELFNSVGEAMKKLPRMGTLAVFADFFGIESVVVMDLVMGRTFHSLKRLEPMELVALLTSLSDLQRAMLQEVINEQVRFMRNESLHDRIDAIAPLIRRTISQEIAAVVAKIRHSTDGSLEAPLQSTVPLLVAAPPPTVDIDALWQGISAVSDDDMEQSSQASSGGGDEPLESRKRKRCM